jgi:hypothetical protein
MTPNEFIEEAIAAGERNGVATLDFDQRLAFLIAEAEADCQANGIDTFLWRYGQERLLETAEAFAAIGASEIAEVFRLLASGRTTDETLLAQVNNLITTCTGYDYQAIRRVIERRLASRRT